MVFVMMEVMNIMEIKYFSIVKNLTMTMEIVMYYRGQQKQDHIQTEGLKLTNSEQCDVCHGSGIAGDGTCSSCNGRGEI